MQKTYVNLSFQINEELRILVQSIWILRTYVLRTFSYLPIYLGFKNRREINAHFAVFSQRTLFFIFCRTEDKRVPRQLDPN